MQGLIALEVERMTEVRTGSDLYVEQTESPNIMSATTKTEANNPADWYPLKVMSARLLVEAEVAALVATHAQQSELKAIKAGGNN